MKAKVMSPFIRRLRLMKLMAQRSRRAQRTATKRNLSFSSTASAHDKSKDSFIGIHNQNKSIDYINHLEASDSDSENDASRAALSSLSTSLPDELILKDVGPQDEIGFKIGSLANESTLVAHGDDDDDDDDAFQLSAENEKEQKNGENASDLLNTHANTKENDSVMDAMKSDFVSGLIKDTAEISNEVIDESARNNTDLNGSGDDGDGDGDSDEEKNEEGDGMEAGLFGAGQSEKESVAGANQLLENVPTARQFSKIDDCTSYVSLCDGQALYVRGKFQVKVLRGQVRIFGSVLDKDTPERTIESPKDRLVFPIEYNSTENSIGNEMDDDQAIPLNLCEFGCIISIYADGAKDAEKNEDEEAEDVTAVRQDERKKLLPQGCSLLTTKEELKDKYYVHSLEWELCISQLLTEESLCAMVTGAKSMGKSTFCRLLCNRALDKTKSPVILLDIDPGQPEYTVPGMVSLVMIKEPNFGCESPNSIEIIRSYYVGVVSPKDIPLMFLSMIKSLWLLFMENYVRYPIIINTFGWVKALGLDLLTEFVEFCSPKTIVRIQSENKRGVRLEFDGILKYELFDILRASPSQSISKNPGEIRNARLTNYFTPNGVEKIVSENVYSVPWRNLAVVFPNLQVDPRHILRALNVSMIGLCVDSSPKMSGDAQMDEKYADYFKVMSFLPPVKCVGLGIIRGIDPAKKLFYITTPVAPELLKDVNVLVRGNIDLPNIYFVQGSGIRAPYLSSNCLPSGDTLHVGGSGYRGRKVGRKRLEGQ